MVGQLEALIGEHPYRERLRTQLTPALYRCDRFIGMRGAWVEPGHRFRSDSPRPEERGVRLRELGLGYDVDAPEGG